MRRLLIIILTRGLKYSSVDYLFFSLINLLIVMLLSYCTMAIIYVLLLMLLSFCSQSTTAPLIAYSFSEVKSMSSFLVPMVEQYLLYMVYIKNIPYLSVCFQVLLDFEINFLSLSSFTIFVFNCYMSSFLLFSKC